MPPETIEHTSTLVYFGDDAFAYAGRHRHDESMRVHTHSFVEIAIVAEGTAVHHSLTGRQPLEVGDTVLLRPGVWHGYEECRGCVARAVGDGARPDAVHPAVVEVMRRIEADPARNWTLADLADGLHLAPGYLVRLFKSVTGLPPMAFLSRHRVELAADMLLHTDRTVRAIAERVGWPDQNYFARRFRAHYGLTASEYRTRFTRGVDLGRVRRSPPAAGSH